MLIVSMDSSFCFALSFRKFRNKTIKELQKERNGANTEKKKRLDAVFRLFSCKKNV